MKSRNSTSGTRIIGIIINYKNSCSSFNSSNTTAEFIYIYQKSHRVKNDEDNWTKFIKDNTQVALSVWDSIVDSK